MEAEEIVIGMGSFEVKGPGFVLSCVGIGSCVATIIYDPQNKVYGIGHIMLPYQQNTQTTNPNKFADVCIPNMIKDLLYLGGERRKLVAKISGGAHMFPTLKQTTMTINSKNVEAVKEVLKKERIPILAEDTGGSIGRTIKLDTATEKVTIVMRSTGEEKNL
jgi:chemotaxis protein CheD